MVLVAKIINTSGMENVIRMFILDQVSAPCIDCEHSLGAFPFFFLQVSQNIAFL